MVFFEILDIELNTKKRIKAQGILEAISDYLPWPSVQVDIDWSPTTGQAVITDKKTDFKYTVTKL